MVPPYAAEWKVGSFNFCLRLELLPQTHRVYTTICPLPLYARYHHSHTLFCQQMRIADIFPLACSNTDLMWLTQNRVYIWPEETATDYIIWYHNKVAIGFRELHVHTLWNCSLSSPAETILQYSSCLLSLLVIGWFTFVFVHFFGSLLRDTEIYWIT